MFILLLATLIVSIGFWGFFVEPRMLVVEKMSLRIKNLPPSLNNLKIVHLTDLHSRGFGKKERRVLSILSQLKPDFVFITGDIVDEKTRDFESCQRFWKKLSENYQARIFGVYGNHEHLIKNFGKLGNLLQESGIKILNNESVILKKENGFTYSVGDSMVSDGIYLIGVDDPYLGYDNIDKAMEGIKEDNPKILLAHSPEIYRKVKDKNIDLILVGHTHGCQVNIPPFCHLFLPMKYDKKYKRGLFKEGSSYMYVNRGIGEIVVPMRLNALPEIGLILLKS